MQPLTPLKETGIYIVEVSTEQHSFEVAYEDNCIYYKWKDLEDDFEIEIPEGNWQILGTITSDIISFDPAAYLESFIAESNNQRCYKDYEYVEKEPKVAGQYFINPKSSFRSLLNSCGYYWVNPMKYPNMGDYIVEDISYEIGFKEDLNRWQSYQNNLVTCILLALIKKQ